MPKTFVLSSTTQLTDADMGAAKAITFNAAGQERILLIETLIAKAIAGVPVIDWDSVIDQKIALALQDVPLTTGLAVGRYELEVTASNKQWVPAAPSGGVVPAAPTISAVETNDIVSVAEAADGVIVSGTAVAASTVSVSWGLVNKSATANGGGAWTTTYAVGEIPAAGATTVSATATTAGGTSTITTRAVTVQSNYAFAAETTLANFSLRADPTATKPAYQGYVTDALTGFRTYRITDRTTMSGGRVLKHYYAKSCPFSADGSKIWINYTYNDAPVVTASTLAYVNKRSYGFEARLAKNIATPDRFYTIGDGAKLRYQNLADADGHWFSNNLVRDFVGDGYTGVTIGNYEGSQTPDDRYWPLIGAKSNGTSDFFIYDKTNNTLSAKWNVPTSVVENSQISPDGAYLTASISGTGGGRSAGVHVFNSSLVYQRTLTAAHNSHGDIAVDTDGIARYVWGKATTAANATFSSVRLDTGVERVEIPASWCTQIHVSATCYRRPGYVLISTFDDDPANYKRRGWNEAYFVKLDGTGTVERVSYIYHPSAGTSTYESQAWAASDPEGYRVVWASCWHNGDPAVSDIETYLAYKPTA